MLSCVRIVPERARQGSTQCLLITGEDFESESSRVPHGEAEGGMDVDSCLRPTSHKTHGSGKKDNYKQLF